MLETRDVVPQQQGSSALTPEQASIGLGLQRYYQFAAVGPTPKRMQMLLNELMRRADAKSAGSPFHKTVR